MDLISKKVSYLKGLAEGYGFDGEKDNMQNIVLSILDCLDLMAEEINFIDSDFERLEQFVEMVDEDLHELEMIFDEDFDEEDFDGYLFDECDYPEFDDREYGEFDDLNWPEEKNRLVDEEE